MWGRLGEGVYSTVARTAKRNRATSQLRLAALFREAVPSTGTYQYYTTKANSMQHTNKTKSDAKRIILAEPPKPKPRSDLATARVPESSYLAKIEPPALGSKSEWVRGAFSRGVSFRDLIRGSGLKTKVVLRLCEIDPDKHAELVAELDHFRTNLLNHK